MAKKWKMTYLTRKEFDETMRTTGLSKGEIQGARRSINRRMPDGVKGYKHTGGKSGCVTFRCSNGNCGESVVNHGTVVCPICGCGGSTTVY